MDRQPGSWRRQLANRPALRSFQYRDFRLWFVGQSISMVGYWVQLVGQALLVIELTDDGTILGLVTALQLLPTLVLGPWSGVLSDRSDNRRLLMYTQSAMMLTAAGLGLLVLADLVNIGWVIAISTMSGVVMALDQPARRVIVVDLVPESELGNAVSLNGAIGNSARVIGPAVAALIVEGVGLGWCFILNAGTFVAVLIALIEIDGRRMERVSPPRAPGQTAEGFRYACSVPSIRLSLFVIAAVSTLGFNWNVLLPLLVTRDLDGSAASLAWVMGAMSIGAVCGTVWLAGRSGSPDRYFAPVSALFGVSSLLVAVAPTTLVATVVVTFYGASALLLFNAIVVQLQTSTRPEMRGRVMALFSTGFLGGGVLGGPLSGWIAEVTSSRVALFVAGLATIGVSVVIVALRHGSFGTARARSVFTDATPALAPSTVARETRSG